MAEALSVRFEVDGLRDLAKQIRKFDASLSKEMRAANRAIADELLSRVKDAAPPGRLQKALKSTSTTENVRLKVGLSPAWAIVEFMGAKRRYGWYSDTKYGLQSQARQYRPWVGNQWVPGARNGAPYYIGAPLDRSMPDVERAYLAMLEQMVLRAVDARGVTDAFLESLVRRSMAGA